MADPVLKHIVVFAYQAWGHSRPLTILVSRLVRLHPVQMTFICHDPLYARINAELARAFEPGEEEYAKRIRVLTVGHADFFTTPESEANFKVTWEHLVKEEPVTCVKHGKVFSALPKPHAVIIDMFAVASFKTIKAISGDSVKVFVWHSAATYELFWFWGPEKLGGKGNIRLKAEEEARRTGAPYNQVSTKVTLALDGNVVRVPALPPMYDYEYYPQEPEIPEAFLVGVILHVHEMFEGSDGVLLYSSEAFQPESIAAVKAWYAETGRAAYVTGPLLPTGSQASKEKSTSADAEEIQNLLDATFETSGEYSLIYISFGSMLWPHKHPEKLWAVLEVIMELGIPFILSKASPFAAIPDDIQVKVKAYGKAVVSAWTPQQTILNHPATGWFLAHGGNNGVLEAVHAGVPQILWPFVGDQPLNAVHMADTLQIAYELLEVRTGTETGLRTIFRNGRTPVGTLDALKAEVRDVLGKAFGEDGARKRERLLALRERVRGGWAEDGASRRDVTAFLQSL